MEPVLTPEEMHAADRAAILAGTPEVVLMERAAGAVARAAVSMLGGTYGRRVVVVCGPGNNGGDGRIAAAMLARRGVRAVVFPTGAGLDRVAFARELARADLAIDAMYGTGLGRALGPDDAWIVERVTAGPPVLAVDIHSGVDGATGVVLGAAVRASRTVTFAARKPGLVFEPGRAHAGAVTVADIGVDPAHGGPGIGLVSDADLASWIPARPADAHKWASAVLVIGGHDGMTGAPVLAGRAALRSGAGLVVAALPGAETARRASGSEIITRGFDADAEGTFASTVAPLLLDATDRFRAVVLGPGLGAGPGVPTVVDRLVGQVSRPLVVDADALNALAGDTTPLRVRAAAGLPAAVLTPHAKEYERLSGGPVGADRVAAARRLAGATGAVVLLKGPGTVIAAPEGRVAIAASGDARLATAGTGDVLSGVIGALLARGVAPFEAAAAAAHAHGRAAEAGPATGLVAGDLADRLPAALTPAP